MNIYAAYVDVSGNAIISDFFPLKVIGFKSNPGISTSSQNLTSRESRSSQEPFMEIHYNEWDKDFLNVYIMSNDPASQKFIGKSKQAINELSQILKDKMRGCTVS